MIYVKKNYDLKNKYTNNELTFNLKIEYKNITIKYLIKNYL